MGAYYGIERSSLEGGGTDDLNLGWCIGGKGVDRHNHIHTEFRCVMDVTLHVGQAFTQQVQVFVSVFGGKRSPRDHFRTTSVHLQGTHRSHQHNHLGNEAGIAALDVEEFFHANISPKPGFGDDIAFRSYQFQGDAVSDDG